MVELLGI